MNKIVSKTSTPPNGTVIRLPRGNIRAQKAARAFYAVTAAHESR